MKTSLLFLFGLFIVVSLAQQQEHYSMYMQNNFLVNPAEGGTDEFADVKVGYRTQWLNFGQGDQGGPKTLFLSGHAPVGKKVTEFEDVRQLPFHGVGGAIIADRIGPFDIITGKASYAYHLPVSQELVLSMGAFVGIKQYRLASEELRFSSDGSLTDPLVSSLKTAISPDITLGIWGYTKDYYFGIAAFQLINSPVELYDAVSSQQNNLEQHYWATAGYKIHFTEHWFIVPSIVAKYVVNTPFTFDFNAKLRYEDKYWAGVSYRLEDAFVLLAGLTIDGKIDIGYSYDITRTDIRKYSAGSHEILLGYRIPLTEHEPPPAQFW